MAGGVFEGDVEEGRILGSWFLDLYEEHGSNGSAVGMNKAQADGVRADALVGVACRESHCRSSIAEFPGRFTNPLGIVDERFEVHGISRRHGRGTRDGVDGHRVRRASLPGADVGRGSGPREAHGRVGVPRQVAVQVQDRGPVVVELDPFHPRDVLGRAHGDEVAALARNAVAVVEPAAIHDRELATAASHRGPRKRSAAIDARAGRRQTMVRVLRVDEARDSVYVVLEHAPVLVGRALFLCLLCGP